MKNLLKLSLIPILTCQALALNVPFNGSMSFNGNDGSFQINQIRIFDYSVQISNQFELGTLPIQSHYETVPVLSSSMLVVPDGHGNNLTADFGFTFLVSRDSSIVDLVSVKSYLEDFSYSGTNQNLILLANSKNSTFNLNSLIYNYYPGQNTPPNLNELALGGKIYQSDFVGHIHTVPDTGDDIIIIMLFVICAFLFITKENRY